MPSNYMIFVFCTFKKNKKKASLYSTLMFFHIKEQNNSREEGGGEGCFNNVVHVIGCLWAAVVHITVCLRLFQHFKGFRQPSEPCMPFSPPPPFPPPTTLPLHWLWMTFHVLSRSRCSTGLATGVVCTRSATAGPHKSWCFKILPH